MMNKSRYDQISNKLDPTPNKTIFIGFNTVSQITNQKRYELVMNQILQYLKTHQHQLKIEIHSNRFLSFKPLFGMEQFTLPLSVLNLHTTYYRIYHENSANNKTPQDVKQFASICWEVLQILRQNFPSKIQLYQQFMELCYPNYKPLSIDQELRRQVSCLISKLQQAKMLYREEIQDVFYTISSCLRRNNFKSILVCLELLSSSFHCPDALLNSAADSRVLDRVIDAVSRCSNDQMLQPADTATNQKIIEICDYLQSKLRKMTRNIEQPLQIKSPSDRFDQNDMKNRMIIQEFKQDHLRKSPNCLPLQERNLNQQSVGLFMTEQQNAMNTSTQSMSRFGKPSSLRVAIFQMVQSDDPDRITFILQTIQNLPNYKFDTLITRYDFKKNLMRLLKNYCNGQYGFQSASVFKNGTFQFYTIQCLIRMCHTRRLYQEMIDATPALELVTQIMQEAIIFVYECAINGSGGDNTQFGSVAFQNKLQEFLNSGLMWFQLALNLQFARWFGNIKAHLVTLEKRMRKLTDEDYEMTRTLTAKFTGLMSVGVQQQQQQQQQQKQRNEGDFDRIDDGSDQLKMVCPVLCCFLRKVQSSKTKFSALAELNEEFGDKFDRLFARSLQSCEENIDNNVFQENEVNNRMKDQKSPEEMRIMAVRQ